MTKLKQAFIQLIKIPKATFKLDDSYWKRSNKKTSLISN